MIKRKKLDRNREGHFTAVENSLRIVRMMESLIVKVVVFLKQVELEECTKGSSRIETEDEQNRPDGADINSTEIGSSIRRCSVDAESVPK